MANDVEKLGNNAFTGERSSRKRWLGLGAVAGGIALAGAMLMSGADWLNPKVTPEKGEEEATAVFVQEDGGHRLPSGAANKEVKAGKSEKLQSGAKNKPTAANKQAAVNTKPNGADIKGQAKGAAGKRAEMNVEAYVKNLTNDIRAGKAIGKKNVVYGVFRDMASAAGGKVDDTLIKMLNTQEGYLIAGTILHGNAFRQNDTRARDIEEGLDDSSMTIILNGIAKGAIKTGGKNSTGEKLFGVLRELGGRRAADKARNKMSPAERAALNQRIKELENNR
ncbi:hypothetical protein FACS1894186_0820 [Alphaproteobacteria bacterium]|nr:hypothetical protein FACS1894186_0820 [Alphaproteobacteria bacterium]